MRTLPSTALPPSPLSEHLPLPSPLTLDELYSPFPSTDDQPAVVPVAAEDLPEPYRRLLAHTHHMTVTVEQFYGGPVDVRVLEAQHDGDSYARKSLLILRDTGAVVQLGVVRIDLSVLAPTVRDEIVSQRTPLGRVLIQNNVLRTVRPVSYFRAVPSARLCEWFGLEQPVPTYGRLGVIYTDHKPAIRVAEILTPVHHDPQMSVRG